MARERVCYLTLGYPPMAGGVAAASGRISRILRDAGYQVHVYVACPSSNLDAVPEFPIGTGIPVERIVTGCEMRANLEHIIHVLLEGDRRFGFDLFHAEFLPLACPCLQVAGPRPVIACLRGGDMDALLHQPRYSEMLHECLAKATWICSANQKYIDIASQLTSVKNRSSIMALDAGFHSSPAWDPKCVLRGTVGHVSLFRPVKNVHVLLEAYARIPTGLRRGLLLVGDYSPEAAGYKERCAEIIQRHSLASEVIITGVLSPEQVAATMRQMRVFVMCSAKEGMPTALVEAASIGVPIVATQVGGMAECVENEVSGLLVPPDDPDALAAAIARVLDDDQLAANLSQGGRRMAESRFGSGNEAHYWLDLYLRISRG
jgi:glycosyltransferase involved in cell wall biosynthesis